MKYEKCLACKQLDNGTCDGPNFMAMSPAELGEWCDAKRKDKPGMTYDRVAAATGISKTAVYSFLKGLNQDYRLETVRPIVKYITGGQWDDNPCGNVTNNEKAAYENRIAALEKILEHEKSWRDDKITHILDENKQINEEYKTATSHLRLEASNKNKIIAVLSACLGVVFLFALVTTLITIRKLN